MPYNYAPTHREDQIILSRFETEHPELYKLHQDFLAYGEVELDAMPRLRFGQHDVGDPPVFSKDRFLDTFGIDTSHHLHPVRQHRVLLDHVLAIEYPSIEARLKSDLELAATIHDMGEPFSGEGDIIAFSQKDETAEINARHEVLRAIVPNRAEEIIDRTEPILSDPTHTGFPIFRMSELIGYGLTGHTAATIYLGRHPDIDMRSYTEAEVRLIGFIANDVYNRTVLNKIVPARSDSRSASHFLLLKGHYLKQAAEVFETQASAT